VRVEGLLAHAERFFTWVRVRVDPDRSEAQARLEAARAVIR
jgi:hypothetical protein